MHTGAKYLCMQNHDYISTSIVGNQYIYIHIYIHVGKLQYFTNLK